MEYVKTIKLSEPVHEGGLIITELRFRKATAKDMGKMRVTSDQRFEDYFSIASKLTGQPTHVIEALSPADWIEVVVYLGESLGGSRATGEKPSDS